jgi:hypothetical protein
VNAAIHDGTEAFHQVPVNIPHIAMTLLIKVHAHDQGLTQLTGFFNETDPGWVMPEDITDDQFLSVPSGSSGHTFSPFHGIGDGLLHEYMAALLESHDGIGFMRIRIGRDADGIRPGFLQRRSVIREEWISATQRFIQPHFAFTCRNQSANVHILAKMISHGMGRSHVSAADDQNFHFIHDLLIFKDGTKQVHAIVNLRHRAVATLLIRKLKLELSIKS